MLSRQEEGEGNLWSIDEQVPGHQGVTLEQVASRAALDAEADFSTRRAHRWAADAPPAVPAGGNADGGEEGRLSREGRGGGGRRSSVLWGIARTRLGEPRQDAQARAGLQPTIGGGGGGGGGCEPQATSRLTSPSCPTAGLADSDAGASSAEPLLHSQQVEERDRLASLIRGSAAQRASLQPERGAATIAGGFVQALLGNVGGGLMLHAATAEELEPPGACSRCVLKGPMGPSRLLG
jgi:hypothetical protein